MKLNAFEAGALTAYHLVVAEISKVPISEISTLAAKIPTLVTEAEGLLVKGADGLEVAATGAQKLQSVVAPLLVFVPEPYQAEATTLLNLLVEGELMAQKVAAFIKTEVAEIETPAAPLPSGETR